MSAVYQCPECGSENYGYEGFGFRDEMVSCRVVCRDCGFKGPCASTFPEATEKWNNLCREALAELHDPLNAIDTWAWENGYI